MTNKMCSCSECERECPQQEENMENLTQMSDTAILNALFDIAAVEANGNGEELTLQDEQEYQRLDWELSKGKAGSKYNG